MSRETDSSRRAFSKRKYRPASRRRLSERDILVLNFLWTWKVASSPMLKAVGYRKKSEWWAYKAIHRLEKEKFIERLPRGRFLSHEVWTLTQLGFEVVLMDRDDIDQYRYRPHSPAHDHLATCLQLGSMWTSSWNKEFITEQMLASLGEDISYGVKLILTKFNKPRSFNRLSAIQVVLL